MQLSTTLSTGLTTMKELRVAFDKTAATDGKNSTISTVSRGVSSSVRPQSRRSDRRRVSSFKITESLAAIFPALEAIELGKNPFVDWSQRGPELAAFWPYEVARSKVSFPCSSYSRLFPQLAGTMAQPHFGGMKPVNLS